MDVVGMIGTDFCGSTLLARALGTLDGVAAGGELHWLTDMKVPYGKERTRAGWLVGTECVLCGPKCIILTQDVIITCRRTGQLYETIGKNLHATHLVVADKRLDIYDKHIAPGKMLGIVLFKSPKRAVASFIKNEGRSVSLALALYVNFYSRALRQAETFCKDVVFVSYEQLAMRPVETVSAISKQFGMPMPAQHITLPTSGYHYVGGNPAAHKRSDIVLDDGWESILTDQQNAIIESRKSDLADDANDLHSDMLALEIL